MARFYEDPRSPIVAELLRQDFDFEEPEALRLIDMDESAHNTDGTIALGTGAACIAATAGTLALSGFTLPILLPAIGIGLSSVTYWNSKVAARNREMETQFLSDHPEVLVKVQSKLRAGESRDTIAAAFEQCLRAYRWGDVEQMKRVLATSPQAASTATQSQSGIQNENDQDAPRSESQALAQTELQPPHVAGDHSGDANKMVAAAAPSMVHSKVLCPIEVLGWEPYQSTALIGGQRSGKTYIVALHTQNVKRSHKSKVIYVNLYDANRDAANDWSHADVCLTFHIKKMGVSQAKAAIEKVTAAVEQFNNDTNAIFVFDEWVAFTSKSNAWAKKASQENTAALVESKVSQCYIAPEGIGTSAVELMNQVMSVSGELGSIGKKQLKAIWLLSPMLKASAVEPQGLVMKDLAPMVVAIPPDRAITWKHPTTGIVQEITFDDAGYRASMVNLGLMPIEKVPHMEVDRMMCLKSTWYSLDNLPALEQTSALETTKLSRGQIDWEYLKVGSPGYPNATDAIDVITEPWESDESIEVDAVEVPRSDNVLPFKPRQEHPLQDKLDRLSSLLEGEDSITVKEIQKKLKLGSSLEAQQLAQIFCMKQKSSYRFGQKANANGTISYFIETVA